MDQQALRLGALECTLVGDLSASPSALVVLCHGYGATRHDLVALAQPLAARLPAGHGVHFVFPEAPLTLDGVFAGAGRAWWPLDFAYLQRRQQGGPEGLLALQEETFAGLPSARRQLRHALEAALQQAGLGYDRLWLGGFSQGAMLSTDLALSLEEAPGGLAVLSGTLIDAARWRKLAKRRTGLRVVQSHGHQDPVLPFAGAEALHQLLVESGLSPRFVPFAGGHAIPEPALAALGEALGTWLSTGPAER